MKTLCLFSAFLLLFSAFALIAADNSEAARMGGGRSFGSRPFMSQPAQRPAPSRQNPGAQSAAPGTQTPRAGGFMGGMLGGLLAGTLLGSLLSGNGFHGGGFMDIILIGGLAFLGYFLYKRFKASQNPQPAGAAPGQTTNFQTAGGWDALRGTNAAEPANANQGVDVPADFNTEEFLRGAKMAYARMQESWDKRDLADIAAFATPAVIDVLKEQLKNDPNPERTEIVLLNASLVGVEDEGANRRAQVYFDALLREDPSAQTPSSAREIWHFLREGQNGSWKLDGIQQVE